MSTDSSVDDVMARAESNVPQVNCVVCGRPRTQCLTPGSEACRFRTAAAGEDVTHTVRRLAGEVEAWAGTAHQIFEALEAAYTGKTRCGWCNVVFESGEEIVRQQHPMTCEKNPLASRLRDVTARLTQMLDDARELNFGDVIDIVHDVVDELKKPL